MVYLGLNLTSSSVRHSKACYQLKYESEYFLHCCEKTHLKSQES